ncbi:MAG: GNAT family N-acetyltransferase [Bacteroidia bacterium]|nr:GNAT family N-acetyltransferase [Bacteroidia bacterium]
MKPVISPVNKELLEAELTDDKIVVHTNKNRKIVYSVTAHDSPNTMREIGRLRELSYRAAGSGTGKDCDIDELDTAEIPYNQLIVWDPREKEILGGYRYILCNTVPKDENGITKIGTSRLFEFSAEFLNNYIPYSIELGRSFIQPAYQSSRIDFRSLFVLDNLWDGIGALVVKYPQVRYFIGQVSIYTDFNRLARDIILFFLAKYFPDPDKLVTAKTPVTINTPEEWLNGLFTGKNFRENYRILSHEIRALKERIPPLVNTYINTSPKMRTFGTTINPFFENMEDTMLMIPIEDVHDARKSRHISTYISFMLKRI